MKASLIAAGGLLFASATFATAMAVPANATSFPHCVLDAGVNGSWIKLTGDDVEIGARRAEVCKRFWDFHRYQDNDHDNDDDGYDYETYDYDY